MEIGSVIWGTMNPEDVIPALRAECEAHGLDAGDADAWVQGDDYWRWLHPDEDRDEAAPEIVADLIDKLNGIAPPQVRFGTHEGDGSDLGWWPDPPEPEYEYQDRESGR